ncbi:LacI family DNA-binding transcriptional regulator [Microbacteriaceae bacterium VKM Ac-2855]|nr:LacI family DNA-binding transcriptional regulator [Microbacteriaceae bacterium VKM Ac-2855]
MSPDRVPVRPPSIRDVARMAEVSHQTVSRVLNDSPSIRPETKQRVLDAMATLGYRPNPAARALVTSRTRSFGVLAAQSAHYGPASSMQAIEAAAREAGYTVSATNVDGTDVASIERGLRRLLDLKVEGLVVIAPQVRVLEVIAGLRLTVPYVTLQSAGEVDDHSYSVDQVAGARLATRHLIELGHTRIRHLAGPQDWIEAQARMRGFFAELEAHGLEAAEPIEGDWTAERGYRVGLQLLHARDATAVFSSNDQMALGLLHAFNEAGASVPGDFSVIGFDDVPEAAHYWPPLTTVRQDFRELGRRCVALLLGELDAAHSGYSGRIQPELVVRSSTAAL